MGEPPKFHPALTVNNIRNFIPIILELENGKYSSWAELFKIHCTAFQVLDHILPPPASGATSTGKDTAESSTTSPAVPTGATTIDAQFSRLDAVVLQWIYGTISTDLLHTILQPNSTAASAWARLRDIFQDNKQSRAVYLEAQFTQLKLENFTSVSAYCQELKNLSDQLMNVNAPVSEDRLVLQLISGLSDSYDTVATFLQQMSPLPSFYDARSRLILEETRKARQAAQTAPSPAAMVTSESPESTPARSTTAPSATRSNTNSATQRGGRRGQRGRGQRGRGRGGYQAQFQPRPPWAQFHGPSQFPAGGPTQFQNNPAWFWQQQQQPWAFPPCPSAQSTPPTPGPGLLGPRPQHVLAAQQTAYTPTDIEHAMQAMSLHNPDTQWYMDTGASSHMTSNSGHQDRDSNPQM